MFLEFGVENFKSLKQRQYLMLEAADSSFKETNLCQINAPRAYRVLKTAVIYGANASGKTNVIAALSNLHDYILNSTDLKNGQRIKWYLPFKFDSHTQSAPTYFMLRFIGPGNVLYQYELEYNQMEVLSEVLDYFPRGHRANLFKRLPNNKITLGKSFADRKIDKRIIHNQLFITKMGNGGHTQMGDIYLYFRTMMLWSIPAKSQLKYLMHKMQKLYVEEKGPEFKARLNELMKVADTKIEGVSVSRRDFTADEHGYLDEDREYQQFRTVAIHKKYENGRVVGTQTIDIKEESVGTQVLFALGGMILDKLEKGGILVIDELDNSLHPELTRFLVELFHDSASNPHNAQLIFATHETSLLASGIFRSDQVCMVQKNEEGATELFSSVDFPAIPDNASLYQYYMRGQMGGLPAIRRIEFIYGKDDKVKEE